MDTQRVVLYVVLSYGLAWALWFYVAYPMAGSAEAPSTALQLTIAAGMFAPALAVALTRLITHEGLADAWVKPHALRTTWRYYVLAWFGPLVLVVAGAALYFLLNQQDFDPSMAHAVQTARAAAQATGVDAPPADDALRGSLVAGLAAIPLAPALNALTCFGEEWGWRGYLLPKLLKRRSLPKALAISGIVWGIWHAPITALGHNYGLGYAGYPFTGIAAMCVFCIVVGAFMSYVTLRTGSCLPAVFAHGMVNGCGAIGTMFSATGGNPFVGPVATGCIGGAFFVVAAALMMRDLMRRGWTPAWPQLPEDARRPSNTGKAQA